MAKIFPESAKYLIKAQFEVNGLVEQTDVIGALFGQTEGLIADFDLRELQQSGRIGRIEVSAEVRNGRCVGRIEIPSSLSLEETCILASCIEGVDRVGPYEAKVSIEKIEDLRVQKRTHVLERAKALLKEALIQLPEGKQASELLRETLRGEEIVEWGPDKLPAGPGVEGCDEIILVEGRADVAALLRSGFPNAIAIGGAGEVPSSLASLTHEKVTTLFIDGDRGGELISRAVGKQCEIDYVAAAPLGTEVEDLSRKEIIKALRKKLPYDAWLRQRQTRRQETQAAHVPQAATPSPTMPSPARASQRGSLLQHLNELAGSLRARLISRDRVVSEVAVSELIDVLQRSSGIDAIALDGIATQRLVEVASQRGVKRIAAMAAQGWLRDVEIILP